jgi:hypothetical protein
MTGRLSPYASTAVVPTPAIPTAPAMRFQWGTSAAAGDAADEAFGNRDGEIGEGDEWWR